MPLASYWMVSAGVVSAAVVLLAIFSMLAMAHRQEEDQDRLENELRLQSIFPSYTSLEDDLISSEALSPPTLNAAAPNPRS